jgi:hypothetical protein
VIPGLFLFWCSTPDHDEDWFVVAHDEAEAVSFHEESEGYEEGEGTAELVCALPAEWRDARPGWPERELLLACGAEFLSTPGEPSIVRILGKVYAEGDLANNAAVMAGFIKKS